MALDRDFSDDDDRKTNFDEQTRKNQGRDGTGIGDDLINTLKIFFLVAFQV